MVLQRLDMRNPFRRNVATLYRLEKFHHLGFNQPGVDVEFGKDIPSGGFPVSAAKWRNSVSGQKGRALPIADREPPRAADCILTETQNRLV
jgi:hypothetical protein